VHYLSKEFFPRDNRGPELRSKRVGVHFLLTPALFVAALVLVAPLMGAVGGSPGPTVRGPSELPLGAIPFSASATWNGANLSSAGSPATAFSIQRGETALVSFDYTGRGTTDVANASLEVTYLGIVLTGAKALAHVTGGPPITGGSQINWSFGPLYDALEGVFQLTASLLYLNGSTAWSQSFYVVVKTPYDLESGTVIVLLILVIAELYWGVSSIREARRGRKPGPPGSPASPSSAPPASGTPPATSGPGPTGVGGPTGGPPGASPPPGPGGSGGGGPP